MAFIPLNGPADQSALVVTDSPIELKVGASALEGRKVVTMQPTDGIVYYGYTNSVTALTGTKVFKNQVVPLEATDQLSVYLVADSGNTIDVRITEIG